MKARRLMMMVVVDDDRSSVDGIIVSDDIVGVGVKAILVFAERLHSILYGDIPVLIFPFDLAS